MLGKLKTSHNLEKWDIIYSDSLILNSLYATAIFIDSLTNV